MRIALIAPPWAPIPPQGYGGIEVVLDHLAVGLQAAGHELLLVTTGDSTCPVPRAAVLDEAAGQNIGMVVPELRHVLGAYDLVQDYDVVHDHTLVGPFYAERYPHLRVVTTIHGPFNDDLIPLYERTADRVPLIAISHAQRKPVPSLPIARVIHHGVDANQFPYRADGESDYVVFLGRMSPDKGAARAIAAARKAGVRLLMAAKMRERAEREYFAAEVEPHLNDDIQYLGEVGHGHKLELLAGAKALLFPIRWNEPFGMVMIEAMACGTPVLAFPEGAAPEVVEDGHTGFLCHDEAEMAEAIGRVDGLSRGDCRAAVQGYFSVERMVAEHVALYEDVLGR